MCGGCGGQAAYYQNDATHAPVYWCTACLPAHLFPRARAGHFPLPPSPYAAQEAAATAEIVAAARAAAQASHS